MINGSREEGGMRGVGMMRNEGNEGRGVIMMGRLRIQVSRNIGLENLHPPRLPYFVHNLRP